MAAPYIHAINSSKIFGNTPEYYLPIHKLLDSSKACIGNNKHRFLTHNVEFIQNILPLIFKNIPNIIDIGLQHLKEDFSNYDLPSINDYYIELNSNNILFKQTNIDIQTQVIMTERLLNIKNPIFKEIHELMENNHIMIVQNSFFSTIIIPLIFGEILDNKIYPIKDIAEKHIIHKYGYLISPGDISQDLTNTKWMSNKKINK
jgi:hypothetical protein